MNRALFKSPLVAWLWCLGLLAGRAAATHSSEPGLSSASEAVHSSEHDDEKLRKAIATLNALYEHMEKKTKEDLANMAGICRKDLRDLVYAYDAKDDKRERPFRASSDEAEFCRRNVYSCCTAREIHKAAKIFKQNLEKLKAEFEPVEELLVLFEGKKYLTIIDGFNLEIGKRKEQCGHLDEGLLSLTSIDTPLYTLTDPDFIRESVQKINSLLVEAQFFIKRQGWFYGNLICIACNPNEQNLFVDDGPTLRLKTVMRSCQEIRDMFDFELRLLQIYAMFLKPMADLHQCVQKADGLTPGAPLPEVDRQTILDLNKKYENCYFSVDPQSETCAEICEKSPFQFVLNHRLRYLYGAALRFYFPIFTGRSIEEYYSSVKEDTFVEDLEIRIPFFSLVGSKKKSMVLDYETTGVYIFGNEMSKKYETLAT